jgi:hypothetical protein
MRKLRSILTARPISAQLLAPDAPPPFPDENPPDFAAAAPPDFPDETLAPDLLVAA